MLQRILSLILFSFVLSAFLITDSSLALLTEDSGPVRQKRDAGARDRFMHDANNIRATISNWGEFGNPSGLPGLFGFEFPRDSGNDFLFSAGLWVGAIVNNNKLVSTGTDGDNGTREFAPSIDNFIFQSNSMHDAPYHFSLIGIDEDGDWNPQTDDLNHDGVPSIDWDGPNNDANGDGIFYYDPEPHIDEDPPGDISNDLIDNDYDGLVDGDDNDFDGDAVPGSDDDDGDGEADEDGAAIAAQHILAIYDDADVDEVQNPDEGGHTPLNIRIEQRTYSLFVENEGFNNALIFEVLIRNIGQETLEEVCFGLFADSDIVARGESGDAGSTDDWNIFADDLLMAIQGDDTTDNDGYGPGVFGMKILHTPRPLDELNVSFKNFERIRGGDPQDNEDKYDMIADDAGNNSPPAEEIGDWRFLIGFRPDNNPWELQPGETLEIAFVMIGAEDIGAIRAAAESIQQLYDSGQWYRLAVEDHDEGLTPASYKLDPNYPNPFNAWTTISFELPSAGITTIALYDLEGRKARTVLNEHLMAGVHSFRIELNGVSSGMYILTLQSGGYRTLGRKIVLVK